jgi:type IV pilus assembly protein PilA
LAITATTDVITVTAQNMPASGSVVLTPTFSGDNSITEWKCTGTPLKWMPGSCK